MDALQAGLVIVAFAAVRLLLPVMALIALSAWSRRHYTQWDLR